MKTKYNRRLYRAMKALPKRIEDSERLQDIAIMTMVMCLVVLAACLASIFLACIHVIVVGDGSALEISSKYSHWFIPVFVLTYFGLLLYEYIKLLRKDRND